MQLYTFSSITVFFNLDIGHIPSRSRSTFFGVKYANLDLGLIGIVTKKMFKFKQNCTQKNVLELCSVVVAAVVAPYHELN